MDAAKTERVAKAARERFVKQEVVNGLGLMIVGEDYDERMKAAQSMAIAQAELYEANMALDAAMRSPSTSGATQ